MMWLYDILLDGKEDARCRKIVAVSRESARACALGLFFGSEMFKVDRERVTVTPRPKCKACGGTGCEQA